MVDENYMKSVLINKLYAIINLFIENDSKWLKLTK